MDFLLGTAEFNQILVTRPGSMFSFSKSQTLIYMREIKVASLPILLGYWAGVKNVL